MSLSLVPLPCTILAVDPGLRSGWVIMRERKVLAFDIAKSALERANAVQKAIELTTPKSPLIAVVEEWTPGWEGKGIKQILGAGASRGRWLEMLELHGHPKLRTLGVDTTTWRKAIFGRQSRKTRTEQWKSMATNLVAQEFNIEAGHDVAEAILIAKWASHASEVYDAIPKRKRSGDEPIRIPFLRVYESEG